MRILSMYSEEEAGLIAPAVRQHLEAGGIIAYPTETVYGFGCLLQPAALDDLVTLKGRAAHQSFIVLSASPRELPGLHWNDAANLLADAFWPGPLTIALRADGYEPPVLSEQGTVAVRATPHVALGTLLRHLEQPLTSTSANLSGEPAAVHVKAVIATLKRAGRDDVVIIDGGPLPPSQPSTVVDCSGGEPRVVREGAVSADALWKVLAGQ